MMLGTIAYESQAGNTTTTQDLIDAVEGLRRTAPKLASKLEEVLQNGDNVDIRLANGTVNPQNGDSRYAVAERDSTTGTIKITISEEYLEEVNYKTNYSTGANAATSLERALTHELVHAWQISTGRPSTGDVGEEQAAAITNEIMKLYGEAPRQGDPTSGAPSYEDSVVNVSSHSVVSYTLLPDRVLPTYVGDVEDKFGDGEDNATPLVLDLSDNDAIDLITLPSSETWWDIDQDGFREKSGWVDAEDGLLAIDLNENGRIDDNGELFGTTDTDGFTVLKQYDSNDDGVIDSQDSVWSDLIIWRDDNEDGYSESSELHTVDDFDIVSFDLAATVVSQTNSGHSVTHTSTFIVDDGVNPADTRIIHDVWFQYDPINSIYTGEIVLDGDALELGLDHRGYGTLPELHLAMSFDNVGTGNLLSLVKNLDGLSFSDIFDETTDLMNDITDIMYRWAGVDGVSASSRGSHIDGRQLEFLEQMMGKDFLQRDIWSNPGPAASKDLEEGFFIAQQNIYARLVAQSAGGELFTGDFYYDIATDAITGVTGLDSTKLSSLESEATALSTTAEKEVFWGNVVRMIEFSVGTTNLPGGDQTALDDAITASDASLDLDDILETLEFPVNDGAFYFGTSGDDTITGASGDNEVYGYDGNDTLSGDTGDDKIFGGYGNDTLDGEEDNDQLEGEGGDDILIGGVGSDYLKGGSGNDEYHYDLGDEDDYIRESNSGAGQFDEIVFGAGIDSGDLTITRVGGSDLLIEIDTGSQTGQIIIENQFNYAAGGGHVEQITFDDASTYDLDDQNYTAYGTSGNDEIYGVHNGSGGLNDDIIYGGAGNDILHGGSGNDSGAGDDTLYGEDGNDELSGGNGADTLYGGAGNDQLNGGGGDDDIHAGTGNDTINGGTGSDNFYYTSDHLTLTQTNDTDTIYLDAAWDSVTPDYFKIDNNLQITFDLDNTITISGFFATYGLDDMVYDDTTTVDLTSISYVTQGTSGNDDLNGTSGDDILYGFAGDDELGTTVYGNGNDTLYGGLGNDVLKGGRHDDYLDGGAGDDEMLGNGGNDHFYYVSGHDIADAGGDTDILEIDGSWDYEDLTLGRYVADTHNLVISLAGGAVNTITVDDMFNGSIMETLRLNDGTGDIDLTSIDYTTYGSAGADSINGITSGGINGGDTNDTIYGYAGADTIEGRDGDDIIYGGDDNDDIEGNSHDDILYGEGGDDYLDGGNDNDILWGGAGDDELRGGSGDDLYVYEEGLDEIYDTNTSTDTLWITNGVVIDEISIADTNDNDATITVNAAVDEIYLDRLEGSGQYHIENLRFDDGFETDELPNYDSWMWGTSGNDSTTGNGNDNVIIGDDGNDDIDAGGGADDVHGGAGTDDIHGDAGDDFLHGGAGDDTLYGDGGLDTLWGGDGEDTFTFDSTNAYTETDVIADFDSANDVIDISDLLSAYDPMTDVLSDFVQITDNGTDSTLSVDADGGADSFAAVASILGVTGLTDEAALETSGALITS